MLKEKKKSNLVICAEMLLALACVSLHMGFYRDYLLSSFKHGEHRCVVTEQSESNNVPQTNTNVWSQGTQLSYPSKYKYTQKRAVN